MRLHFKPVFFAMVLFIVIFTISCGADLAPTKSKTVDTEEQEPIPPPEGSGGSGTDPDGEITDKCEAITGGAATGVNKAITADNLTGRYEIIYFYSFADNPFKPTTIDTSNTSNVQNFTGEAIINVIDGKLHLTTKIRLDSKELEGLIGIAGDQRYQYVVYNTIDAIANNGIVGVYDKDTFTDTNYDLRVVNDELLLRQKFVQKDVPVVKTANVTLNMKLKKISDNPIELPKENYPTFDKPVADENITPFPIDTTAGLELEKIDIKKWHGQYKMTQVDITKGDKTYSSTKRADIIDFIGAASVQVMEGECVNPLKVTTKHEIETQNSDGIETYKFDNYTIINGLQTKDGVVGQYNEEADSDTNFKLEFINDNLTITKRVNGIGYKFTLTKENQSVLPMNDEVYWPRTSILEGKEGVLGYYRITALSGYLTSGSNRFYGNMMIYVDDKKTKAAGKTVIGMKIRWQSNNDKSGMRDWQNRNTWATLNYNKMTDDYSNFFKDIQCVGSTWNPIRICNPLPLALPKPTDTTANISFDATNKYRGNRGFDIGGGMLTLYITKLYDLSPTKTIKEGDYF